MSEICHYPKNGSNGCFISDLWWPLGYYIHDQKPKEIYIGSHKIPIELRTRPKRLSDS